jgi:hypothetical protein
MLGLLLEATSFSSAQRQVVEKELLSLRNKVYAEQLQNMQWEKLRVDKEDTLSSRHQSLAALSLRCWELTVQSAPYINADNEARLNKLNAQMNEELGKIKEIYRLDGEIQSYSAGLSELEKYDNTVRDARNQFLAAAQARLKSVEDLYWAAYWKMDEPWTWRLQAVVQDPLREAYSKVLSINDVDLKLVSDGDYNKYKNLKEHIVEYLLDKYESPVEVTLSIENFMPKESGQ